MANSKVTKLDFRNVTDQITQGFKLAQNEIATTINSKEFTDAFPTSVSIPGLDKSELTGVLAGMKKGAASLTGKIGDLGLDPRGLETAGVLKPGTFDRYISGSEDQLNEILNNPVHWTGEGGAFSLNEFIANPKLQQKTAEQMLVKGNELLKESGMINGEEPPEILAGVNQLIAQFDIGEVTSYLNDTLNDPEKKTQMDQFMNDAVANIKTVVRKLPQEIKGIKEGAAYAGTTVRKGLDNALSLITGDDRLPVFNFGGGEGPVESVDTVGKQIDLQQLQKELDRAQVELENAIELGTDVGLINSKTAEVEKIQKQFVKEFNQAKTAFPGALAEAQQKLSEVNLDAAAEKASTELNDLGTLFNTNLDSALSQAQAQLPGAVSQAQAQLPGAIAQAQAELPGALEQANNALPGMLENLQTQLNSVKFPDAQTIRNQRVTPPAKNTTVKPKTYNFNKR